MSKILKQTDVWNQSKSVIEARGATWMKNAKINSEMKGWRDGNELFQCGVGKAIVLCAMGESLEELAPIIAKYRDRVDVACVDKAFGPLLDCGVKADYVMMCDADIPVKYLHKWVDQTEGVKLIATPYANPEWTSRWKGERYHVLFRDAIDSHRMFYRFFPRTIRHMIASTNVSNALLVHFLGIDDQNRANWSGYEQFHLVGYDYSWRPEKRGKYYAWENPTPKRYYMNHRTLLDLNNEVVFTSNNLFFSAKWLFDYLTSIKAPVYQCSGRGILDTNQRGNLETMLSSINPDPRVREKIRAAFETVKAANVALAEATKSFNYIREDLHHARS